ncbi:MAG: hypothetical protein R6X17_00470 [Candidatus Competibacteraceae bacterium]
MNDCLRPSRVVPFKNSARRAGRVDIQALLRHVQLATTQIYTHVDQDRMAAVVNKM